MKTIYIEEKGDITERKVKKITKKIYKLSKKEDIVLAISKNLEDNIALKNEIKGYKLKVLDGRWLFKFLLYDILEYLSKMQNKQMETLIIALLMNEMDEIVMQELSEIARRVKALKIVTENINKYEYIEEKLFKEFGIAMQITNNKSKALNNVDIVLNFDFNEEKLKECNINKCGTIVNINRKINLNLQGFNGKNINDYEISFKEENFENDIKKEEFSNNILYESYIYRRDNFINIRKQLKKDEVKLVKIF